MLEELQDSAGARGAGGTGASNSGLQHQPQVLGPLSSLLTCGMQNTKMKKSRSG